MKKQMKNFSAEVKTKIVLELLKEDATIAHLALKYEITCKTIQNWKKHFLNNAALAFEPAKVLIEYKDQIDELKLQNDKLAKTLGKTIIERDWALGKLISLDLSNKKNIVNSKLKLSKTRQCKLLKINRSNIYYQPKNNCNLNILNKINEIYINNPEYGYRFIQKQLAEENVVIGKDRVLKYMQIMGIRAIYPHKKPVYVKNNHKIYKYLLDKYWINSEKARMLAVKNVNEIWSGDITYIKVSGGFVYFAAVIEWHSKAILSYKLSNSMDQSLTTEVLKDALNKYPKPKIFNSDQGSQYTGNEHVNILKDHNIEISMNGKGRSIDNIVIERFFRTLKYNCIFLNEFKNIKMLKETIDIYIEKYNNQRFHSTINYKKPMNVYRDFLKKIA